MDEGIAGAAKDLIAAHGAERALDIALKRAAALELNPQDSVARRWSLIAEAVTGLVDRSALAKAKKAA